MSTPDTERMPAELVVPVITPLDDQERVDEPAFRAVIRRCLDAGADGIFAGGSAGMGPLLPGDQWQRVMEIARSEVAEDRLLMGGVITTSTARAMEQIRVLESLRFESMVVTPPFYIPLSGDREYLVSVAEKSQVETNGRIRLSVKI